MIVLSMDSCLWEASRNKSESRFAAVNPPLSRVPFHFFTPFKHNLFIELIHVFILAFQFIQSSIDVSF
ncbi:hypothetical protein L596_020890 [Steinernema carpocapsae]|uniref:Uncharacterized protein n=1 Tax=Steinernema carpocapsae TaxID=34508 RepID=A0A4U5MVL2_STECR|nr:hypothetical protein L596_020890 [Steinernema carpocapsae]